MRSVPPDENPQLKVLIEKLIDSYKTSLFSEKFKQLTSQLTTAEAFYIKQELARLFKPALRTIDMSRYSQYDVFEFDYNGRHFYLDEIGKRIFLQQASRFSDQYTQGVYEAVSNPKYYAEFEKVYIYEQNVKRFRLELTELGRTGKRLEERLFCAKPVTIIRQDGSELKAMTSNISRNGCLLRVFPFAALNQDEIFQISFYSLTEHFSLSQEPKPLYQVKFLAPMPDPDGGQKVGVQLFEKDYEWSQFLDRYVLDNKSTYKVDISNAKALAETRLLEEHLLLLSRWSMLFTTRDTNGQIAVRYSLSNQHNSDFINLLKNSDNSSALTGLIQRLAPQINTNSQIICIVRYHYKGRSDYLAASLEQLLTQQTFAALAAFAAKFGELRFYSAHFIELTEHDIENIKFNWFKSQIEADEALAPIQQIERLYCFYPLDLDLNTLFEQPLTEIDISEQDKNSLAKYRCRIQHNNKPAIFDVSGRCQRSEPRYFWSTPAVVYLNEDEQIQSKIKDISEHGLAVELPELPSDIALGKTLAVHIPAVYKINKKSELEWIFYKIVAINDNRIHLQLLNNTINQTAEHFIGKLIAANKDKFKSNDNTTNYTILNKALRILFVSHYPSIAFSIGRSKTKFLTAERMLTADREVNELKILQQLGGTTGSQDISVYPILFDGSQSPNYLPAAIKFTQQKKKIIERLFYRRHGEAEKIKRKDGLSNDQTSLNNFVESAVSNDKLISFALTLTPVEFNHTECIDKTLEYIRSSNRHQALNIQSMATNLIGLAEVTSSTELWQNLPQMLTQLKKAR
ncbi:PilZ domain-containing protein [Gayadomonas joobiniege]|uniref:PilZ domain-containing protein n=1 Tax=Gayadomonas joobiniege TaxID=1234606 RepID=UPI0003687947|nr:PilZ domain-containing protein [Gayadomonas joobiniege]